MSTENSINGLASGLRELYEPGLRKLQTELAELTAKQEIILNEVSLENEKYHQVELNDTSAMFMMAKDCHMRLIHLKREMSTLSERSAKIKRRAVRLAEWRQREREEAARLRESQLRQEEALIAKPRP